MMSAFYRFAYIVVNIFLFITGWKVVGRENIPQDKSYIVIANHRKYADPVLIGCTFPKQVHFLYKSEFETSPFTARLFHLCGAVPLKRSAADLTAMKMAMRELKRGHMVGIFPEGRRNKTDEPLLSFEEGAAFMAYRSGVPILPVGILNSGHMGKFWKRDVLLVIGEPFEVVSDKEDLRKNLDYYNELCRERILALLQDGQKLLLKK